MKRRLKKRLSDSNFEFAKTILVKMFSEKVIPTDLALRLDAYVAKPGVDTATDLILYDSELIYVFELARSGGFSELMFRKEKNREKADKTYNMVNDHDDT